MVGRRRRVVGSLLGGNDLAGHVRSRGGTRRRSARGSGRRRPGRRRRRRRRRSIARRTSPIRRAAQGRRLGRRRGRRSGQRRQGGHCRRRRRRRAPSRTRTRPRSDVAGRRQRRHRLRRGQPDAADRRPPDRQRRGQERQHRSGSRTRAACRPAPTRARNGNYAGAKFMHFENLGYDFLFGDGTGGLSIWSLKNPEHAAVRRRRPGLRADAAGRRARPGRHRRRASTRVRTPPSTRAASWPSWPATRARSATAATRTAAPASTSSTSRTRGTRRSSRYHWVPAGHTATCINDCRYLWSVGPANNGSHVNGQPQDVAGVLHPEWTGVPVVRHRRARPAAPVHVRQPVDMKRNNNTTAYTHSRRRRPGRHRLDVRLRRRPRLLHERPAPRPDDGRGPLRDGDRPGPVRGRQRPVARDRRAVRARSASSTTRTT